MTWRQIKPELFRLKENSEITEAVVTLEHIGIGSQPSGDKAHIISDDHCYVLCIISNELFQNGDVSEAMFHFSPWWFWEAVQALKSLPHPDEVHEWIAVESTDKEIKHIPVDDNT